MRALHVVLLCVLFVALGFMYKFSGTPILPGSSVAMPLTSADATAGLACIQNALGGERAFADVASLRIRADTKPSASTGLRPLPRTREISVVFPDRYKRVEVGQPRTPGASTLSSIVGFDGPVMLTRPGMPPEGAVLRMGTREDLARQLMRSARADFARQMVMRLPRESASVSLSQRLTQDAGHERLAIDASGPDDLRATLLADAGTCVPTALQYEGIDHSGSITVRVDLSDYREFGGVRFATLLKTSHNGEPYAEEAVSTVELNAPDAAEYFAPDR